MFNYCTLQVLICGLAHVWILPLRLVIQQAFRLPLSCLRSWILNASVGSIIVEATICIMKILSNSHFITYLTDNEYERKHTMFVCLFVCLFVCSCVHTYVAFHPNFVLLQNISSAFPNAAVMPLYNHASNLLGALEAAYKVCAWRWPFCSI